MAVPVSAAVEGDLDEVVVIRLLEEAGFEAGPIHGKSGKTRLLSRLPGYNRAAEHSPWFVLVDLDQDEPCAPPFVATHLPTRAAQMCFRVAVKQVEAWLLGDRQRVAGFLGVSQALIPRDPEVIEDAKSLVINLARRSSKRSIREDLVPRAGSGRTVGPLYTSRMAEFARESWRPAVAASVVDSLSRSITRLGELAQ